MAETDKSTVEDLRRDLLPSPADGVLTVARTALGIIPLAGSSVAELLTATLESPLAKRRDNWLIKLYEGLRELQERVNGFDPNNLVDNEQFITAATYASQIVLRTHQQKKLEALKNAVLNSAIQTNIPDDYQIIFLNFVDTLTPSHLDVLSFARSPKTWLEAHDIPLDEDYMITRPSREYALLDYQKDPNFYGLVINDLKSRGLIETDPLWSLDNTLSRDKLEMSFVTDLGHNFLRYISEPQIAINEAEH
jgi:hypothetical protein